MPGTESALPPTASTALPMSSVPAGAGPATASVYSGRRDLPALLGLLALAAALRLWMFRFPFEQDELYTFFEARDLFATQLEPGIDARPLYYLFQHALLWVLPPTEFWLRLPPLVFGLAGVAMTWYAARRFFGGGAALVAGLAVTLAPWHIHISAMARYWSLLYLLAAIYFLSLVLGYRSDGRRPLMFALVALVAGTATHPTFAFAAAGGALGASLVRADGSFGWRWPSRRAWTLLWLPYATFLAVGALALSLTGNEEAVRNWGSRGLLAGLRLVPAIVEWLTPLVAIAAAIGIVLALGTRDPARRTWAAVAFGGATVGVLLLIAASAVTSVYADYAAAALPLLFIGVGALAASALERLRSGGTQFLAVCLLLIGGALLPNVASQLSSGTRFDYRPAFRHIQQTAPDRPVLMWPVVLQQHYAPGLDGRVLRIQRQFLDETLGQEGDLWLVASLRRYGYSWDDSHILPAWLERNCTLEHTYERARFDYRRYRAELYRCRSSGL